MTNGQSIIRSRHSTFVIRRSNILPAMLSTALIHEIDRLLKEGELSHRKIAARLGVSRGVVNAIADGRRGLYGNDLLAQDRRSLTPMSPAERCSQCGYRVYLPCLICEAREHAYYKNGRSRIGNGQVSSTGG
jgi:hypothetical protein